MANNASNRRRKSARKGKSRSESRDNKRKNEPEVREDNNPRSNVTYEASDNDPAWYASNEQLLRDAFSYPFNSIPGSTISMNPPHRVVNYTSDSSTWTFGDSADPNTKGDCVSPGLMAFYLRSRYDTEEATNALNTAATSQYIYTNSLNSRNYSYDPNDLMLYNLAMTEVYSAIVWLQRIYSLSWMYAQMSSYMPYAALKASGVNVSSISEQLASFREGINWIIAQVNALPVPSTMKLYQRKVFLYNELYTEGADVKDQQYMLCPQSFYFFFLDDEGKGCLKEVAVPTMSGLDSAATVAEADLIDILAYVQDMFNRIWTMQDHQTMGADILRAYGSNIIKLLPMEPNTYVVPRPDQYLVLEQLKNATIIDCDLSQGVLSQDMQLNRLKFYQSADLAHEHGTLLKLTQPAIITTINSETPPALLAELTRLTAVGRAVLDANGNITDYRISTGTEFVSRVFVITRQATDNGTLGDLEMVGLRAHNNVHFTLTASQAPISPMMNILRRIEVASAFQYHPHLEASFVADEASNNHHFIGEQYHYIQLDNYTTLGFDDLVPMNAVALMSLLSVPTLIVGKQ